MRSAHPPEVLAALADPANRIGNYVLLGELGKGGMGVVYRAYDGALRRPVAIKMILDPSQAGEEQVRRFEREASAAARLRHPGIVSVFETGRHAGKPYIVMELVPGESLEKLLAREKVPPRRAAELVRGVALALGHAHESGVVHRDVKPENVIVDSEGRTHLMDFGLARELGEAERVTVTGQVLGTPSYMAPEQAAGETAEQGPATDVHALGALLYRALCGKPPFAASTLPALLKKIMLDEPAPPRKLRATVHADLETIAMRCLAKEPARRYANAGLVAEELRRFLDGEPIVARPAGRIERAVLWARRNRKLALALGALAVVVVGAAIAGGAQGAALAKLEDEKAEAQRQREARAASVSRILEDARAGKVASQSDHEAALGKLVSMTELGTVELVARALDTVTARLQAATRSVYMKARQPTPDEARLGAAGLDGLEAALDRLRDLAPGEDLDGPALAVLGRAADRLEARAAAAHTRANAAAPTLNALIVAAQREELGSAGDSLARLACDALGRMGIRDAAVPALARHLFAERDGERAARAGEALCHLGGETAERLVLVASKRLDERYLELVSRFLAETGVETKLAADTPAAHLERGRVRQEKGDLAGALADFSRAIELDREGAAGWEARGVARLGKRDVAGALADLDHAVQLDPRSPAAWCGHGEVRAKERQFDLAIADFSRAIELDGRCLRAWLGRGETKGQLGEFKDALSDLAHATELDPRSARAWASLADARTSSGDPRGGSDDASHAIELDARYAIAWVFRARARERLHDLTGSLADASRAVALDPADGRTWFARAWVRLMAGDDEGAIADATRTMRLNPNMMGSWICRGQARAHRGEVDGALADFEHVLEVDPGNPHALEERGRLRAAATGDFAGAVKDLSRAVDEQPGNAELLVRRGYARARSGDLDGALADYTRACELDPKSGEARFRRAGALEEKGELDAAIEEYSEALRLDRGHALTWHNRGRIYANRRNLNAAIADFSQALELDPKLAEAWTNRAGAKAMKGELEGALSDLSRALELDPRLAECWRLRGAIRFKNGDREGATSDFERFLELAPNDPRAPGVRASLAKIRAER